MNNRESQINSRIAEIDRQLIEKEKKLEVLRKEREEEINNRLIQVNKKLEEKEKELETLRRSKK